MPKRTAVKICCISSHAEAKLAIDYGASAIGLVGEMPSGPGVIKDKVIKEIAKGIPSDIDTFLLTSKTSAIEIIAHHNKVNTTVIQLVDAIDFSEYAIIRQALPDVKLVQVIHVLDKESIEEALKVSAFVDYVLLDSGNPNLQIKELGGTGRTHNWAISKEIVQALSIPVLLAGGLNPDNVEEAIGLVQPYGVDLCTGVRTNGNLDESKLGRFIKAVEGKDLN